MSMENERLVATIAKNKQEEIRVSTGEFNGVPILSLRVFFQSEDGWRPGKQGLACRLELLPQLTAALAEAVRS